MTYLDVMLIMRIYAQPSPRHSQNFSESPQESRDYRDREIKSYLKTYLKQLFFHGTDTPSARDICKHGMSLKRKNEAGNAALLAQNYGLEDRSAPKYHYVQKTAEEAAEYAKGFSNPAILCLILPKHKYSLQIDPEGDSSTAFMLSKKISKEYVLPQDPANLHTSQLRRLNRKLGLPKLEREELQKLKDLVRKKILFDRSQTIQQAKSYLEQEKERDDLTKKALREQGIDLSSLKPGDSFSVAID